MKKWKQLKKELLKDKKVKIEYQALSPKYQVITQVIEARLKNRLTQAEMAERIGTKQSVIARFESGNVNPTISFLEKIANALDLKLKIDFT